MKKHYKCKICDKPISYQTAKYGEYHEICEERYDECRELDRQIKKNSRKLNILYRNLREFNKNMVYSFFCKNQNIYLLISKALKNCYKRNKRALSLIKFRLIKENYTNLEILKEICNWLSKKFYFFGTNYNFIKEKVRQHNEVWYVLINKLVEELLECIEECLIEVEVPKDLIERLENEEVPDRKKYLNLQEE